METADPFLEHLKNFKTIKCQNIEFIGEATNNYGNGSNIY